MKFIIRLNIEVSKGTYRKEAQGSLQCTLVCVGVGVMGVRVSSGGSWEGAGGPQGPGQVSQPGVRRQQAARGSSPTTQTRDCSCPLEGKRKKDGGGRGLILQGSAGLRGSGGAPAAVSQMAEGTLVAAPPSRAMGWPNIRLLGKRDRFITRLCPGPLPAVFLPRLWERILQVPGHPNPASALSYHTS